MKAAGSLNVFNVQANRRVKWVFPQPLPAASETSGSGLRVFKLNEEEVPLFNGEHRRTPF